MFYSILQIIFFLGVILSAKVQNKHGLEVFIDVIGVQIRGKSQEKERQETDTLSTLQWFDSNSVFVPNKVFAISLLHNLGVISQYLLHNQH